MNTTEDFRDTDDGHPDAVQHVGAMLYAARSAGGHALDDIAADLNIRSDHLRALEEGWWDELPSQAYAVGFLKSYARYLGLNAGEIVSRYKCENSHFDSDVASQCHSMQLQPIEESRIPKTPIVILSAFFALAGYCGWYFLEGSAYVAADSASAIPAHLASLVPEQAPLVTAPVVANNVPAREAAAAIAPASAPAKPAVQLAEVKVDASSRIAMVATPHRVQRPLARIEQAQRQTVASALSRFTSPTLIRTANAATGDDYADSRITLKARSDTWIMVQDPKSGTLRQGVLRAGEQYRAPNEKGLTLTTSNLAALDIIVDGTPVPAKPHSSSIARDLPLDADQLASL